MRNRTRDIIKRIAEAQGVTYYYGDWARANLVADKVPDDVVFMVDIQQLRGRMVLWNGSTINDSPEVMWAFMKRLPSEQAVGERDDIHDDIVQECKEMLFRMVAAVNTSGYFEQIDGDFEYEIHPERFDAVFTGVFVQLNIVPTTPMCLDDIEFTPYDPCDDCPPEPCPPCPEPPEPPVEAPIRDVCLFDYDGFCAYSYDAADFLALTELPEPLEHEGLTAQGWNWTLADAQAHVRKYRQLNIGAHYVTDTGETRLYISLAQSMEIECWLTATDPTKIIIDWGDGTTTVGWSASTNKHTYAVGNYVMRISTTDGATYQLGQGLYQRNVLGQYTATSIIKGCSLEKVEIGSAVTNIADICFSSCCNLQSYAGPAIPIGDQTFYNCRALSFVTLPQNIGTGVIQATQIMKYISYAFNSSQSTTYLIPAYNRRRETWGDTLTTIVSQTLNSASSMYEIYIPDSVTSIANQAFINSNTLREIYIYPTTPPTLGARAFTLAAGAKIYVPHGKLNDYQTAENWAAYASYMVEMSE